MTTDSSPKLYIAGMGMVTPVGGNVAMTAAAVNAGIGAYKSSQFVNTDGNPITVTSIPWRLFANMEACIGEGDRFDEHHDHIIRMAILAIREACADINITGSVPLIVALSDRHRDMSGLVSLTQSLVENCAPIIDPSLTRSIHSGRAAGIEAIDFAFNYLLGSTHDYFLIGGSDSFLNGAWLHQLDNEQRLLAVDNTNGFAPGEGAGFLLLTNHKELALQRNGKIIALNKPGIADEPGNLYSNEAYRGDGLAGAFKKALENHQQKNIGCIYSSMNGEHYWAKEMGVSHIRNQKFFTANIKIKHPADCFGDLGAAIAPITIALAAEDLFRQDNIQASLVYSSSDTPRRGAVVLEKVKAVAMQL